MIKIGILGDIGSGKSFVAKSFGFPVFDADYEVSKLYQKDKLVFKKLNKILPNYLSSFPINKNEIIHSILDNKKNLKKIIKIIHLEIRKKLNIFFKKNRNQKIVILDIPLLLENKLNSKKDILVFVQAKRSDILSRIKKRKNYNKDLIKMFKQIQLPLNYKKRKSNFIIKNNFRKTPVKNNVRDILKKI